MLKTVQNKLHWVAHGKTAAEKIFNSAGALKPKMGMTTFNAKEIRQADALVAKNYCTEDEIFALNDVVSAYLEFAETQAQLVLKLLSKKPRRRIKSIKLCKQKIPPRLKKTI